MIEKILVKFKKEITYSGFKIYLVLNFLVICFLLAELSFFGYGILKIARYLIILQALFVIAWIDYRKRIIPNRILLFLVLCRLFLLLAEWISYPALGFSLLISSVMGAVIGGMVFLLCFLVSKGGMGAGDVKLYTVLGLYLGNGVIMPNMILTVFSSAVYSIVQLVRKKTNLKEEIPFGPFVLIGTIVTMALGI